MNDPSGTDKKIVELLQQSFSLKEQNAWKMSTAYVN